MKHAGLAALLILSLFCACRQDKPVAREIRPAFYHWRTDYNPDSVEREALEVHHVKRIYIKYFDIDWPDDRDKAIPMAKVQWPRVTPKGMEVVPVVFITNRTFLKIAMGDVEDLAKATGELIHRIQPKECDYYKEIQIDCDWTARTKAAYFSFLKYLRVRMGESYVKLSATIRLHQYRWPKKTGVPPVDRGMVMLYNTGDLDDPAEDNSILGMDDLRSYLEAASPYPLPTDVALPIFAWSVLIRRGQPIRLMNNLTMAELLSNPDFAKTAENRVEVKRNHYFRNHYLYAGDQIRAEAIPPNQLIEMARYAAAKISPAPLHVCLYQLDHARLEAFPSSTLAAVFDAFRHPAVQPGTP